MSKPDVQIGAWLGRAFNLYKDNFVLLFSATILAALLSGLSLGVLAGPMMVGLVLIGLKLQDGEAKKAKVGDLFEGFELFIPSLLYVAMVVVLNIVGSAILGRFPLVGGILSFAFSIALSTALMFGFPLIAEKGLGVTAAAQKSFELVKENFLAFALYSFVVGVCASLGVFAFGVGIVLTMPFGVAALCVAYRAVSPAGPDAVSEVPPKKVANI